MEILWKTTVRAYLSGSKVQKFQLVPGTDRLFDLLLYIYYCLHAPTFFSQYGGLFSLKIARLPCQDQAFRDLLAILRSNLSDFQFRQEGLETPVPCLGNRLFIITKYCVQQLSKGMVTMYGNIAEGSDVDFCFQNETSHWGKPAYKILGEPQPVH